MASRRNILAVLVLGAMLVTLPSWGAAMDAALELTATQQKQFTELRQTTSYVRRDHQAIRGCLLRGLLRGGATSRQNQ